MRCWGHRGGSDDGVTSELGWRGIPGRAHSGHKGVEAHVKHVWFQVWNRAMSLELGGFFC